MTDYRRGFATALLAALCAAACPEPAGAQQPAGAGVPAGAQPLAAPQLPPEPPFVGHAPYAPEALVPDNAPPQRSVVFDKPKARALDEAQQPAYITRIDVTGTPEPPPVKAKSFEQRFSEALNPPASFFGGHSYSNSTEPCPTLLSPGTPFTQSYNVYGFCP